MRSIFFHVHCTIAHVRFPAQFNFFFLGEGGSSLRKNNSLNLVNSTKEIAESNYRRNACEILDTLGHLL